MESRKNKKGGVLHRDNSFNELRPANVERCTESTVGNVESSKADHRRRLPSVEGTSRGSISGSKKISFASNSLKRKISKTFVHRSSRGQLSKKKDVQRPKKKSNKKLPQEVSSRRPHRVATLPVLPSDTIAQQGEEESNTEDGSEDQEEEEKSGHEENGVRKRSRGVGNADLHQGQPSSGGPNNVPLHSFVQNGRGSTLPPKLLKRKEALMRMHLKRLVTLNSQQRRKAKGLVGQNGRDPRFLNACGPLDVRMVSKAYSFLDDVRKQEAEELKAMIKTGKRSGYTGDDRLHLQNKKQRKLGAAEREQAKIELQRLQSQEQTRKRRRAEIDVKRRLAKEEVEKIARTGKAPYFLKKVEFKKLVTEELHARGGVGAKKKAKLEERKTKKILAKEKKRELVPVRRRVAAEE
ncbi:rrna processing protein [Cystoisospora suis]|uniref:rRNA biogenesis protein RRP36 n=1 Tax=Cystoisospora suis TaxID=483139 RepID=A0A2C6JP06_9APIC|nr:rrna processing protein [Cystoisospora suis]